MTTNWIWITSDRTFSRALKNLSLSPLSSMVHIGTSQYDSMMVDHLYFQHFLGIHTAPTAFQTAFTALRLCTTFLIHTHIYTYIHDLGHGIKGLVILARKIYYKYNHWFRQLRGTGTNGLPAFDGLLQPALHVVTHDLCNVCTTQSIAPPVDQN